VPSDDFTTGVSNEIHVTVLGRSRGDEVEFDIVDAPRAAVLAFVFEAGKMETYQAANCAAFELNQFCVSG